MPSPSDPQPPSDRQPPSDPQPGHYFNAEPTAISARRTIELALPDVQLRLLTDRGVFSAERVDAGTKLLLLEGPGPISSDHVLVDLGAGYGPIACTLARRNPQATVYAVEINARARALCAENAEANDLANLVVIDPGQMPDDVVIDRIWSNPPIRVGKSALHELLSSWLTRLGPSGSAHLVVQKHLGADSLVRWLEAEGFPAERRSSRKAYRLIDVGPRSAASTNTDLSNEPESP